MIQLNKPRKQLDLNILMDISDKRRHISTEIWWIHYDHLWFPCEVVLMELERSVESIIESYTV
jgi:hypothetical protein